MKYVPALLRGEAIEPVISNETYGWLLSVYLPVRNSAGECMCYAAVDISMKERVRTERMFLVRVLALFFGFFILILAVSLWLAEYSITLPINSMAMVARMTRSSMLEVIRQDYISTAQAKGLNDHVITTQHMLRNALIPIITAVGLQFGHLLGGAMLAETVFSWPGLGRLMVDSIKSRDIPMVLGCVVFMATMFSIVNLIVDIVYAFVDPRIKSMYKKGN